jgi:hypothetical protein
LEVFIHAIFGNNKRLYRSIINKNWILVWLGINLSFGCCLNAHPDQPFYKPISLEFSTPKPPSSIAGIVDNTYHTYSIFLCFFFSIFLQIKLENLYDWFYEYYTPFLDFTDHFQTFLSKNSNQFDWWFHTSVPSSQLQLHGHRGESKRAWLFRKTYQQPTSR